MSHIQPSVEKVPEDTKYLSENLHGTISIENGKDEQYSVVITTIQEPEDPMSNIS